MKNIQNEIFERKVSQRSKLAYADLGKKLDGRLSAIGNDLYSEPDYMRKTVGEKMKIVTGEILAMNRPTATPAELAAESLYVDELAAKATEKLRMADALGTDRLFEVLKNQVSVLIAFVALGSGFGFCEEIAKAVNIFCSKMFPAGISETRVGRAVKNFERDFERFICEIFRVGSGDSPDGATSAVTYDNTKINNLRRTQMSGNFERQKP